MPTYERDDLEFNKFIKPISVVKVDVHHYKRVTFTYDATFTDRVVTRTDYDNDKTTIIRVLTYSYDASGNVIEIEDTTP